MEVRRDGPRPGRTVAYTFLILIFFAVIAGVAYIRSPFAQVQSVQVVGARDVDATLLLRDAGVSAGENMFSISPAAISGRLLADFPLLKSVKVERDWLTRRVLIAVQERRLAGILDANGNLYQILADGIVLGRDPSGIGVDKPILTTNMPLSISLGSRVNDPALLSVCRQLPGIPPNLLAPISSISVTTSHGQETLLAFTRDGFEVQMPVGGMQDSLALYAGIHARLVASGVKPGLVVVMSGGQAVYKPYAQAGGAGRGGA